MVLEPSMYAGVSADFLVVYMAKMLEKAIFSTTTQAVGVSKFQCVQPLDFSPEWDEKEGRVLTIRNLVQEGDMELLTEERKYSNTAG